MLSPHILSLRMKRIKSLLTALEDDERGCAEIDRLAASKLDPVYFGADVTKAIKQNLALASLMMVQFHKDIAMGYLSNIRNILDRVMIRELIFANRLVKELPPVPPDAGAGSEYDLIGTVSQLPDLVKMNIYQILYRDI
jgi:hypothetical protein